MGLVSGLARARREGLSSVVGRDIGPVGGGKASGKGKVEGRDGGRGSRPSSNSQGSRRRKAGGTKLRNRCRSCGPGRKGGDRGLELRACPARSHVKPLSGPGKLRCGPAAFLSRSPERLQRLGGLA